MIFRRLIQRGRQASVTVEFALVASLFLLPLFMGSSDLIILISSRAQLNAAIEALYYFAWTNPTSAADTTQLNEVIAAINASSNYQITQPVVTTSYVCVTPGSPPKTTSVSGPGLCNSDQIQQTLVTYSVSTTVSLPVPFPGISSPTTQTARGTIQTQ